MKKDRLWQMSRRTFLGGAGAAIALPFLESFAPAGWRRQALAMESGTPPMRMLYYYVPCGIHMASWTPAGAGPEWELTHILEPLEPVKPQVSVITGLDNHPAKPDGPGDHASGTGAFLTGAHPFKTEGADIRNGVSVDQVAAERLAAQTRFPSLQLGLEGGASVGGCDSGYSCAYSRNISWAGPATPLPKMTSPDLVFDRLFGGFDPAADAAESERRRLFRQSVLDTALADANALHARLSSSDQAKLDEYLTGVRALEQQIENLEDAPVCLPPEFPDGDIDIPAHIDVMTKLMVTAFECDITRITSFMFANAGSNRFYDFLGVSGGHHDISHHQNDPEKHAMLEVIDRWEIEQFSALLQAMSQVEEADGTTMLDNSLVFFSSEIEDGNRHGHTNLPILLAGGAGGAFTPGSHHIYDDDPPISNLFVSILHMFGVEVETFGDEGTGPLF